MRSSPGGAFVAYQVRDRVHMLGREVFGRARVQTELLERAADADLPLGEARREPRRAPRPV